MTFPSSEQPQRRTDVGRAGGRFDDDGWFSGGYDQGHIDHLDWLAHGGDPATADDTEHGAEYSDVVPIGQYRGPADVVNVDPTQAAVQQARRAVQHLPRTGPATTAGPAEDVRRDELARYADADQYSRGSAEWGDAR